VVATPIGNLADITLRALEILRAVDLIAAEDTRHTSGLLSHYAIQKKLLAVHEHNEQHAATQLLERLRGGESVALVTDAGTPGISDPGAVVVDIVRDAGIAVVPIPGASAVIAAMSAAGIRANGFSFVGFLPASGSQRRKALDALKTHGATLVFYEAPHRVLESVRDMAAVLGDGRRLTLGRELTKTFETIKGAPLGELHDWVAGDSNQQRGECVLLVEGWQEPEGEETLSAEALRVLDLLLAELPLKRAAALAAEITGVRKNLLYQRALERQKAED